MDFRAVLDFLVPPDWVWDRFYQLFTNPLENWWFIIAWFLTMVFGFQQYIAAKKIVLRDGFAAPYPYYMHTFYFAHDATWFFVFLITAIKYLNCWWFWIMVPAFGWWTWSEMTVIRATINNDTERNKTWAVSHPNGISKKEAWADTALQIAVFWGVTQLFRLFMGSGSLWQWTILTNVLMQVGPVQFWRSWKTIQGTSVRLAVWILLCTIYTFSPISAYVVGFPEIFHKPTFYISGIIMIIVGIYGVILTKGMPKNMEEYEAREKARKTSP